jgi:hypothetical protein
LAKRLRKPEQETRIEREVRLWLNDKGRDYDNGWRGAYRDLAYGGCSSGIVSTLIYNRDTHAFFERHKDAINVMVAEALADFGRAMGRMSDLFISWDNDDPLALESTNRDYLAWFAFERTAFNIASQNGEN